MAWLWLTLAAQFLFSVGTHLDKFLLSRYFPTSSAGSLILFASLVAAAALPVVAVVRPDVLAMRAPDVLVVVGASFLNITGVVLSYYAMKEDEPSVVATLFQMIPLFNYGLAYLLLHETLSPLQVVGASLVIVGAVGVSLDLTGRRVGVKTSVLWKMAVASLFIAANLVVFKKVAVEGDFWATTFWSYAALVIAGVVLLAFVPSYRVPFARTLRSNTVPVIALNVANEAMAIAGYVMISYATMLVPVTLVSVLSGFQPLMVFLLGVILARCFPSLAHESLTRKQAAQKLVAMAVMLVGTWLLQR